MYELFFLYTQPSRPYDNITQDAGLITTGFLSNTLIFPNRQTWRSRSSRGGQEWFHQGWWAHTTSVLLPSMGTSSSLFSLHLQPFGLFFFFFLYTFPCLPDNFLACYRAAESRSSQADLWGRSTVISATGMNTSIVTVQWLSFGAIEPYKPSLWQNAVHTANTPMYAFLVWSWDIQQKAAFKGISSYWSYV